MKKLIYPIILLLFISCNTDEEVLPGKKKAKLLWKTQLREGNNFAFSMTPVNGKENIVFSVLPLRGGQSSLMALDKHNGEIRWKWEHTDSDSRGSITATNAHLYNGVLAYIPRVPAYGFDMSSGAMLWQKKLYPAGEYRSSGHEESILHLFKEESFPHKNGDIHLTILNIESGNHKIAYSIQGDAKWSPRMSNYLMRISAQQDTILYMMGVLYNIDERLIDPFFIGYNLTQDKILFEYKEEHNSGFLMLVEDKLLMGNHKKMICYSANTGSILWELDFQDFGLASKPTIKDGKLLLHVQNIVEDRLRMYELSSQKLLWEVNNKNINSHDLIMHEGMIYAIMDSQLSGIRASDGKLLWQIPSPDEGRHSYIGFNTLITLDPDFDRIYVSDFFSALCYQLR